jgi:hypothetical protein
MGFLDNSSITVDAILTKAGRQILAAGGNLGITKFALSDEEVDYTLWDVTHPNGTDSYGTVIENMSLLEATPARTNFRSYLIDQSLAGTSLNVGQTNHTDIAHSTTITITPTTTGGAAENYIFTIENTNIVKFGGGYVGRTTQDSSVDLITQSINPGATTTVAVTGANTGLTSVITISVTTDPTSTTDPFSGESGFGGGGSAGGGGYGGGYGGGKGGYGKGKGGKGSDIRLKTNIVPLGYSPSNIPIYSFNYKNNLNITYSGVMAQDLLDMNLNHAVAKDSDGFYSVFYDNIDVDMKTLH